MEILKHIAPEWALKRKVSRMKLDALAHNDGGGYEGASKKRKIFKNWGTSGADANDDLDIAAPVMRERSRDLYKNTHIAAAALDTKLQYVIGAGLIPEPVINHAALGITLEQAEQLADEMKAIFMDWAESKESDYQGLKNFFQKQRETYFCKNMNGTGVVLLPYVNDGELESGHRIHTVEADRLCNPESKKNTDRLRSGVETDSRGRIKKIHIAKRMPNGPGKRLKRGDWQAVSHKRANGWVNFLLVNNKANRPGQYLGVPDLAPVVTAIKQLGQTVDAELLASVISSKFTVFVTHKSPNGIANGLAPGGAMAGAAGTTQPATDAQDSNEPIELNDGAIIDLGTDEDVTIADPTRPNPNLGPFMDKLATYIGSATGLPFEILARHFTASYSASKAALMMFANWLAVERGEFIRDFCQPIYEMVIEEAAAQGRINLPGFFGDRQTRRAYLSCMWHGAPVGEIDEVKAATAAKIRLETRVTNRTIESRRHGLDQDQVRAVAAAEKRKDQEAGILGATMSMVEPVEPTDQVDKDEPEE
ncbi:MAG: hypothetical protein CMB99_16370 [Flavobacteriaceae bacterium]|nr:hypothetical protein [Flavobacteriaceae bacterium]|tara:strand:- start:35023 stop:36627 length:1605 start_codon:yes stop_codon:yes gene_type:complete